MKSAAAIDSRYLLPSGCTKLPSLNIQESSFRIDVILVQATGEMRKEFQGGSNALFRVRHSWHCTIGRHWSNSCR